MSNEQRQSQAVKSANSHFRKQVQAKDGSEAWADYMAEQDATRRKTTRLRELRLARDAEAASRASERARARQPFK